MTSLIRSDKDIHKNAHKTYTKKRRELNSFFIIKPKKAVILNCFTNPNIKSKSYAEPGGMMRC